MLTFSDADLHVLSLKLQIFSNDVPHNKTQTFCGRYFVFGCGFLFRLKTDSHSALPLHFMNLKLLTVGKFYIFDFSLGKYDSIADHLGASHDQTDISLGNHPYPLYIKFINMVLIREIFL